MTGIQVFAFLILPLLVLAIGVGGALLHDRSIRREIEAQKLHPGE